MGSPCWKAKTNEDSVEEIPKPKPQKKSEKPKPTPSPVPKTKKKPPPQSKPSRTKLPEPKPSQTKLPEPKPSRTKLPKPKPSQTKLPEPKPSWTKLPVPKPSPPKLPEPTLPSLHYQVLAAKKIQAWWRGILVRRILLSAALNAWIIQCWWRKILAKSLEEKRLESLHRMVLETRACVTIQSWVRMVQVRQLYLRLLNAAHIIQVSWRWHNCHTRGFFQGSYEITGNKMRLWLDIFLGPQVCRISDCISFPIKN